jgi:Flp pilus assembly protein TadB
MIPYDVSMNYMTAGYTVIFIVLAVYLTSLAVRFHRLRRDKQLLEEQENQ